MKTVEEAGSWRMLCMSVLHESVVLLQKGRNGSIRSDAQEIKDAQNWIDSGDIGLVTFDECCGILGLPTDTVRQKISEYARTPARKPAYKRNEKVYEAYKNWEETGQTEEAETFAVA